MLTQDVLEHASNEIYLSVRAESVYLRLAGDCLALLAFATSVPSCFCVAGVALASKTLSIRLWTPPSRSSDAELLRYCAMTVAVHMMQCLLLTMATLVSVWTLSRQIYDKSNLMAWRCASVICGVISGCCFVTCTSATLLMLVVKLELCAARSKIGQRYLGAVHLLHRGGYPLQEAHELSLRTIRGLSPVQALVDAPPELQSQPAVGRPVAEAPVLGRAVAQRHPAQETIGVPLQSRRWTRSTTIHPQAPLPDGYPTWTSMSSTLERIEYWKNQYLWWTRTEHDASASPVASGPPSAVFRSHPARVSPRVLDDASATYSL